MMFLRWNNDERLAIEAGAEYKQILYMLPGWVLGIVPQGVA